MRDIYAVLRGNRTLRTAPSRPQALRSVTPLQMRTEEEAGHSRAASCSPEVRTESATQQEVALAQQFAIVDETDVLAVRAQ
jgi:hypothetical protein